MRSAKALERLCLVLAMTTLYLVSVGTSVVKKGHRRLVDPHWFRGASYLKIGWNWVKALVGFQGRRFVDGVQPDFCLSLLLEALIFQ